jgi:hypothetical protein
VIEVRPEAPDPVVAKVEDCRVRLVDRGAAALPASVEPTQREHAVAEIAKLFSDALELLPVFAGVGDEPSTPSRPR